MDKKKFIQITSGEIASITHEMFFDYTDEIIRKSNPLLMCDKEVIEV